MLIHLNKNSKSMKNARDQPAGAYLLFRLPKIIEAASG